MLTVEQVLANNSINENVLISITEYNWKTFSELLHEQGYKWVDGETIIGDDLWDLESCFDDTIHHLLFICLNSETKTITYSDYSSMQELDFFHEVSDNNYCIIKPFEHLLKEIEELT